MSGDRLLLDTNAIIQLLTGNPAMSDIAASAGFLATSVICQLEFLSYPPLDDVSRRAFLRFLSRIRVFGVHPSDSDLIRETVALRVESRLKLPDAIIAATALVNDCILVSADAHFRKLVRVPLQTYPL
jgi:predicted nucleic acid-binding protein